MAATGIDTNVRQAAVGSIDIAGNYQLELEQLKESRQLSISIQQSADALLAQGLPDAALTTLAAAMMADPGRVGIVHQMGKCLERFGQQAEAVSCYRGTIPDCLNQRFFNAAGVSEKIKPASDCHEVTLLNAHDPESIDLVAPRRNDTDKHYGQFQYSSTEARATFSTVAKEGAIWFDGFNTIAFDSHGNIISEHIMGNEFACYPTTQMIRPYQIDGSICFLDARSSYIYYHWMLDVLPKIGVLEKSGINPDNIDYFVVKAESKYQIESLRLLGIEEERLICMTGSQYFTAREVIIPYLYNSLGQRTYHGLGVGLSSWIPTYLQRQFGPSVSIPAEQQPMEERTPTKRRIYISRSTRGSRNIANETEIIALLAERGFETVEFEHLTINEQAALMAQSEMVVGVHGAGFTNLSFCHPGTRVVEIFGEYIVPCYWALSTVADLSYYQFMAESVSDDTIDSDNPGAKVTVLRDQQIKVDVEQFAACLDSIINDSILE